MPNVKIYVEEAVYATSADALAALLPALRDLLCDRLKVGPPACQLALIPVRGLPDQPLVNVEMMILPHPDRTRVALLALSQSIRDMLAPATGAQAAVRIAHLDAATYLALK